MRGVVLLAAALALALATTLAGCGGDNGGDDLTTTTIPLNVVPWESGEVERIVVTRGDETAEAPRDVREAASPLLTVRVFDPDGDLSEYGLDAPDVTVTYVNRDGSLAELAVGGPNFDHLGYYVRRSGDASVYLVLTDQIGPLLSLVGIEPATTTTLPGTTR